MREIHEGFRTRDIGAVRLFQEDLEDLLAIVSRAAKEVRLTIDEWEFNDLADIRENRGERPRRLKVDVTTKDAYGSLTIKFNKYSVDISSSGAGGVCGKAVRDFLLLKRRATGYISAPTWSSIGVGLWAIALTIGLGTHGAWSVCANLVALYVAFGPKPFLWNELILTNRYRYPSFWTRHEDKVWGLVINLIVAALSAVVTWYFTGRH